ncbi:MAG: hypothetical protein CME69_09755 [Halobacteriovorax sp.]|nr:hypothetical protein [Halobacteriovorax sp.]
MDRHLKLNQKFYDQIDKIKSKTMRYRSHLERSKSHLEIARTISKEDIFDRLGALKENPSPKDVIYLFRNLLNSGVWISRSTYKYISASINYTEKGDNQVLNEDEIEIIKAISEGRELENYSEEEIFRVIFNEMEYSHYFPDHESLLQVPKTDITIVLVSGVFNELFSTAAFERAAIHMHKKYGIKFYAPEVNGFKSSKYNSKLLERQLSKYISENKDETLWLVAFSKGGLDSLHFLAQNNSFAKEHIVGLSTIASPIMGSDHLNHTLFKVLNGVHHFSKTRVYQILSQKNDIMAREFQKSISSTYQRPWLRKNYENLPKDIFYTALGFKSEWYESHFWMILTKILFQSSSKNDGVVDTTNSLFPKYFEEAHNLGIHEGHHLVGTRSSFFCQEALIESLLIFVNYKKLLK